MATISPNGLDTLTKHFEGCHLTAYQDETGVWTIGWGHTGPEIHGGLIIAQAQADEWLEQDMGRFSWAVQAMLVRSATKNQFDALVDFAYNEGAHALLTSRLLSFFNAGDIRAAAQQFAEWDLDTPPHIAQGLVRRRVAELILFLTP